MSNASHGNSDHRAVEVIERVHQHPAAALLSPTQRDELAIACAIRDHAERWWARRGVTLKPIEETDHAK